MSTKVTFKKHNGTTWSPSTYFDLKIKKNKFGMITSISKNEWIIQLMIIKADIMEDGNKNCTWKWTTLKYRGTTADEAKDWVSENIDLIQERFNLYLSE